MLVVSFSSALNTISHITLIGKLNTLLEQNTLQLDIGLPSQAEPGQSGLGVAPPQR